jgi:hypothetical protein
MESANESGLKKVKLHHEECKKIEECSYPILVTRKRFFTTIA